jgi:ABC-type amino acid transport substrate-binding protein
MLKKQNGNTQKNKELIRAFIVLGSEGGQGGEVTYLTTNKDGKKIYKGFAYDIWTKVKEKLKDKYEFEEIFSKKGAINYDQFVEELGSGKYDVLVGLIIPTIKREKLINYTTPIMKDGNTIIHKNKHTLMQKIKYDLSHGGMFILILLIFGIIFGIILYLVEPNRGSFLPSIAKNKRLPKMSLKFLNIRRSLLTTISAFLGEMGFLAENSSLTIPGIITVIAIMIIAFMLILFIQSEITLSLLYNDDTYNISKLRQYTFLGIKGYATGKNIEKYGGNVTFIDNVTVEDLIKKYLENTDKYAGVVGSYIDLAPFLKKYPNLTLTYKNLGETNLHFGVEEKKEEFLNDLNLELINMKDNLEMQSMCNQYFKNSYFCELT